MEKVRTRFAPSPTGFLHVGGVRTALFAWLVARQAEGDFLLRIEDTDKAREVAGSEQHIKDSLEWLGLKWDQEPYRQSEHLKTYRQWAEKLMVAGRAYADTSTPEQLEELRRQSAAQKKPFLFRDYRPASPPVWDGKSPLRFKSEPKSYKWHDEVVGELSTGPEVVDDFIIIKSDGYPTYNFAHVIDDHLMKISHVIRSQEFLASVPKFLNLYEALQIDRPKLATLPYVMGPDGKKKLSKRDGAKDILDYRKAGYLPEALINFLATLGWNDGTEQEIFSVDELIQKFSLGRVHKGGAHFDEQRLNWMNGHYIRHQPLDDLLTRVDGFWPPQAANASDDYKKAVLELAQERLKFLSELPELTDFFFAEPVPQKVKALFDNPPDKGLKAVGKGDYLRFLKASEDELSSSDFSLADINSRLNLLLQALDLKPSVLLPIIRIAISGSASTPPIAATLQVLGKQKVMNRLNQAASVLEN